MQKKKIFATNRNVKKTGKKYTKSLIFFDFLNSIFEIKIMILIMIRPTEKKVVSLHTLCQYSFWMKKIVQEYNVNQWNLW